MKVFKFGGASVNSADAVRNMAQIVQSHLEPGKPLVVVVSAMGKTTNLLEKLVPGVTGDTHELRRQLEEYHLKIYKELIPCVDDADNAVQELLRKLDGMLATLQPSNEQYNYNYDQVVSFGELISTTIIAEYLNSHGISTLWLDARQLIITDTAWNKLSAEQQAAVQEAADYASQVCRQVSESKEAETLEALKAEGCTIIEVPDKTPWVEAVKDVVTANINGEDAAYQAILGMK